MTSPSQNLLTVLERYASTPILLALSGGGDSVGLLRALLETGVSVVAGHFDHALREESAQDAQFVHDLCRGLNVPLELERTNVARITQSKGWGLEEAARELRYGFLTRAAKKHGIHTILTAHTLEDQAETVLMQLLRGTSKAAGMPFKRGPLERPWLGVARAEIRTYLNTLNQDWLEDASNLDSRFTRNWLRLEVLPRLRERYPRVIEALSRYADYAREDDDFLEGLRAAVTPYADWRHEPAPIQRRLFVHALEQAGFKPDSEGLERIQSALYSPKVQHLALPHISSEFRTLNVQGGKLQLEPPTSKKPDFEYPFLWTLRHRERGDVMAQGGGTRKLSDVLIDLKVPRAWREELWLLAEGKQVKWLGLEPALWAKGVGFNVTPWWLEMGHALEQAEQAALEGEVPVGAAVFRGTQIVGRGRNRSREAGDMTRHAELEALREASLTVGPYLTECTLVVTLEPCPMCLGAALAARVARVVYGAANPKLGALGGVTDLLRHHWGHALEVVPGVRSGEAAGLLERFFAGLREAGLQGESA